MNVILLEFKKDRKTPVDWSVIDYSDYDNEEEEYLSDDYYASEQITSNSNRRPTIKTKSLVVPKTLPEQSNSVHVDEKYLDSRKAPNRIYKIFSEIKPRTEVMKILKEIQDEEDRLLQLTDKDGTATTSQMLSSSPRQVIGEHFKQDEKQVLTYLQTSALKRFQYGILLFNSERQIFIIQNHQGIWNPPIGHRRINNNYQLETINETVFRVFNTLICAKNQLTDETFHFDDLHDNQHTDFHKYIEKRLNHNTVQNDSIEQVGLFISLFDDPILEFELRDTRENQTCQWVSIDDLLKHNQNLQCDLIQPFAEYIESRMFDLTKQFQHSMNFDNDVQQKPLEDVAANQTINTPCPSPLTKPKRCLPISDDIFNRASQCITFESDDSVVAVQYNNYKPKILASFSITQSLPADHVNIGQYNQCISYRLRIPCYDQPQVNSTFPRQVRKAFIPQPEKTSILPILIAAHCHRVDIHKYDVISERNSLMKIALNEAKYVVGVKKIDQTLFIRRHDKRSIDFNSTEFRFERMCSHEHHQHLRFKRLIEGQIGDFATLITAQADAIHRQTGQAIKLKSRTNGNDIGNRADCWLQAFLGSAQSVVVGYCTTEEPPRLRRIREYPTPNIIEDGVKGQIFAHLHQVLHFLHKNSGSSR
ncbi:unnamed protein product [Adineta ricciae]|uniref:Uncharacterized protein n=1 Tax=Adineta ricciae TaxID=249248 RepID=A0A815JJL7_ADIRI|nr:unnamed protein product [Adineta ricciae]CAF1476745.1 unnamed protein product [Adineta ricciae]